jgi:hypothetical protein
VDRGHIIAAALETMPQSPQGGRLKAPKPGQVCLWASRGSLVGSWVIPAAQRSVFNLVAQVLLAAYVCGTAIVMIYVLGPIDLVGGLFSLACAPLTSSADTSISKTPAELLGRATRV